MMVLSKKEKAPGTFRFANAKKPITAKKDMRGGFEYAPDEKTDAIRFKVRRKQDPS